MGTAGTNGTEASTGPLAVGWWLTGLTASPTPVSAAATMLACFAVSRYGPGGNAWRRCCGMRRIPR